MDSLVPRFERVGALAALMVGAFPATTVGATATAPPRSPAVTMGRVGGGVGAGVTEEREQKKRSENLFHIAAPFCIVSFITG